MQSPVLELRPQGLYCPAGDFFIDPWRPVPRAIVTHAHSDHARYGMKHYLSTPATREFMRVRISNKINADAIEFGEQVKVGDATVSLHPAGHILGSAQVRVEVAGEVWVFSGDYKTEAEPSCEAFECVRCHTFITETTFGLPVYQWRPQAELMAEINAWWYGNARQGKASLLAGYALGKCQRLLMGVDPSIGPIYVHGAVANMNEVCQNMGLKLPPTRKAPKDKGSKEVSGALVLLPPNALSTNWVRRFGPSEEAFASGWMSVRGIRRRRGVQRGFGVSDHVDWPSLMHVIQETGAEQVLTTHGYAVQVSRFLREKGMRSSPLETPFSEEPEEATDDVR